MNVDECKEQTQVFDLGNNIRSFLKWNIMDNTLLQVPLIVSLKPGEDAVLIPCKSDYVPQEKLTDYEFALEKDQISWENNYLVVDMLRYSFDNCNFSEPWPVAALFEKLLKDRYAGNIYFKYEFDVKVVPEEIRLRCENVNVVQEWLNGKTLTDRILTKENYINLYDVATFIKQGKNEYVVEVQWHEDEAAYHALFGENVTEALKNCLVYDSELQPIQLEGKFGVFSATGYWEDEHTEYVSGNDFYIGEIPGKVSELVTDGFPFFAGKFSAKREVILENSRVLLKLPGNYQMAEVKVNGTKMPRLLFEKELDISQVVNTGKNLLEVSYWVSNRNLLGPHHFIHSKLQGATPWMFELGGTWEEDKSPYYHEYFDLRKFYK